MILYVLYNKANSQCTNTLPLSDNFTEEKHSLEQAHPCLHFTEWEMSTS